jgi:hypothetical protein
MNNLGINDPISISWDSDVVGILFEDASNFCFSTILRKRVEGL